ncbi:MAG TPA: rhomboid family intramembrane serine protease [Candidatus Hydrogenedentes bacterium]|nr:rhomboid family intramembrane serine protease [Candidatus Hydrogenedentota bacterium]HOV74537.1 rhomboid family intramembrane serine protease [Candidatus Hydrogenedentota bacterium]HPC18184.1 rhomboid family intramembrane serine protease [Candidatus Hydrogenedentota bacterium]HRT21785.1 rhomboid family intramembrane serine protease [Candidatus Hydrogenedentota bacterium]HRT66595.1 rhomboid family intramembrane serine protease [Candidatus Hydrogenedentota bacterium]
MNTFYYERRYEGFGETDNRITWAVQRLILFNIAVFSAQLVLDIPFGLPLLAGGGSAPPGGAITEFFAFQPGAFYMGKIWKALTYFSLHNGLLHLFLNMLWLYFFGPEVERALGSRQFILFYVLCGALGVLGSFVPVVMGGVDVSITGASGAAMGVMVAFAVLSPERQFFFFPLPIPINARTLVYIIIAMNVVSALQDGGTSVATHFGGMAVGYAYMQLAPRFISWRRSQWLERGRPRNTADPLDKIGEAVDNIFRFDDKRKGR